MDEDKKDETKKEEPKAKEEQKLVLSTTKSIHKPIVIVIDGQSFENNPLSRALFDEVSKWEKAALEGDIEALYKQVEILYSVPLDVLNKLDVRDVDSLLDYTMKKIFKAAAETRKEKAEKNALRPGPKESVSSPANSQAS